MSAEPSVERALLLLTGRCDGAVELDGEGFNAFDTLLGHAFAERVTSGIGLTDKQRRAAWRMLRKYADQLSRLGLDWSAVPYPEDAAPSAEVSRRLAAAGRQVSRATVEDGRIVVRSPFQMKEVCRSIPGKRWVPQVAPKGAWTYPASPRSARNVVDALEPHGLVTDDAVRALLDEHARQAAAAVHKSAEDLPPIPGESLQSWLHQRQAYWFAREQDAALLWMEMGTGKSKVVVDLLRTTGARQAIILCPLKVLGVWPKQFRIHGGHGDPDLFHVLNGMVQQRTGSWVVDSVTGRVRTFDEALHECSCGRPHVVVANYEITAFEPFKSWALEQEWDYAVLDESHRIRSSNGVWSRWCAKLRDHSRRRLCATGTMLGQSELDAFGQYRFLDPSIFGVSYTSFEWRYAVKGGYQGHEVVAMRTKPTVRNRSGEEVANPHYDQAIAREFDDKVFSVAYEVDASVLELPPEHDVTRTCQLSARAQRTYRQLDQDLFAELMDLGGGELSTPNVLAKMLRLQQLTGGHLPDDDGRVLQVDTAKEELLEDVLTNIDPAEPVVVFCRFVADLRTVQRVTERLGREYAELSGGRSDGLTQDSTLALRRGVTAVQIQAGGVGVDFTAAHFGVYYSLGFSRIDYVQSRRRLHRPGQEHPTTFVHLVASGTVDEDVYEALARNEDAVQFVAKRRIQDLQQGRPSA